MSAPAVEDCSPIPASASPLAPPPRRLHILLTTFGSHGDVHPFITIAAALKQRGHDVTLIINSYFERQAARAGLNVVSSGPASEYEALLRDPLLWSGGRASRRALLDKGIGPIIPRVYQEIAARRQPERTVLLASPWCFSARIVEEKLDVPLATLAVSPESMMSARDPGPAFLHRIPLPLRKMLARWVQNRILDPELLPHINRGRTLAGLAPLRRGAAQWWFSPRRVIGLWPEWFAAPQPDWPANSRTTGFVMYDGAGPNPELPARVRDFLAAGPSPIAFVSSTAMRNAGRFLPESVKACQLLGRRGILLCSAEEPNLPKLPDSILQVDYAPFSKLFPQCRAVVHHGAIGTAAFALSAGLPQLAVPHGADQIDNAARLQRLGNTIIVPPNRYTADRAAKMLAHLLWSTEVADRCAHYQRLLNDARPLDEICRLIEELAEQPRAKNA